MSPMGKDRCPGLDIDTYIYASNVPCLGLDVRGEGTTVAGEKERQISYHSIRGTSAGARDYISRPSSGWKLSILESYIQISFC